MSLVSTNWLEQNINNVKIIDCSWHMPQANRSGFEEYLKEHIPNAIFFDLDKNSKTNTDLPHMLTDLNSWEKIMSEMGINNNDEIKNFLFRTKKFLIFSFLVFSSIIATSSSIIKSYFLEHTVIFHHFYNILIHF